MMEPVLNLITSYESRISTVEDLISTTYQATVASEGSFSALDDERERLETGLQKMLAKNCSLRRKDFNRLMEMVLVGLNRKREAIEKERGRLREKVKEYLDEQRELTIYLRQQLIQLVQEKTDKGSIEALIGNIKSTYQDASQRLFTMLRDFQIDLAAFQREQEEINNKLGRLMDRGESLEIEDLRQLEAAEAREGRKAERELRREEMERLLAHFKQQRQESSRH